MSDQDTLDQPMFNLDYKQRLLVAVTSLTDEMSRASSKEEVLTLTAAWVPNIVPADRASITFPVDDENLSVHALEGNKAIPMGVFVPIANTTTGTAFRELRSVLIEDTSTRSEMDSQILASKGLVTCINAPMVSQGCAIGTINVAHWKSGVYTPEHVALLAHVAGVVAAQLNLLDRFFTTQENLEAMVSERTKELEEQKARLQLALDKEKELNGLQCQFVSMVSHEFRTPLAIIDGSAQRIIRRHDKIGTEKMLDGLGKIRTSVSRLTDLIESVLSAARLENGSIAVEPRPFDIREMIGEICRSLQQMSPNHRILYDMRHMPEEVDGDETLLRLVVSNLISNAVKYCPEGSRIWVEGKASDPSSVCFVVRDEGPGISPHELDKLFDRYYRASTSTGIIGTGIGLHIVQVLVDLHGGHVDVSSVEGEGTTFRVMLPRKMPSPKVG